MRTPIKLRLVITKPQEVEDADYSAFEEFRANLLDFDECDDTDEAQCAPFRL
jgi:hypothetical protein